MATFGFIGTGNMGGALARAARKRLSGDEVLLANRTAAKAEALAKELDCRAVDNETAAREADYLFLGVKPQMMEEMLAGIAPVLAARKDRFLLVTMAAGLTIARIRELAGGDFPVIRIMPNTPAAIGEGMVLYALGPGVTAEEERTFLDAMAGAGRFSSLPERLIDAGSAVAGCGPAFVDLFIEALADGGVACGLPRAPGADLCRPDGGGFRQAGTGERAAPRRAEGRGPAPPAAPTIQGVRALEAGGFRSAVMEAVIAAYEKNGDLK